MDNKQNMKKLPGLIASIKIEPGTLGAPPGRLPSFGGRRDLTLGSSGPSRINQNVDSKPKRIYTPNFNVQRNKNKVDMNLKEEHPNNRDKRDKRKDDWKGRKRDKINNLIQSAGVFSEGIAGAAKNRRYGGGGGGERDSAASFMQKPKLNLKHDWKIDKDEEEMKLKELLRDDFVDDPGVEPDADNAPVRLPMLSLAKVKTELKEEIGVVKPPNREVFGGIKIKQEKVDPEEVEEKDIKPKLVNGKIVSEKEPEITKMKSPDEITIEDLFDNREAQLIFLQMPDCLPGLKPEAESGPARPSTSGKPIATVSSQSLPAETENSATSKHCTFNTLSEGCIGKLQLLKSGKARLVLGNTVLHVDMGTQIGFRQDLISVDLDPSTRGGDMINLGPVKTRLVCSPDWETMLNKAVI